MTEHPDNIRVVVVGGPGKHSSLIPSWGMTRSVTLPVEAMTVRIYRPDGDVDTTLIRARRPGRRASPAVASRCSTTASPTPWWS